jgi:hypothetical protein
VVIALFSDLLGAGFLVGSLIGLAILAVRSQS